jgi:cellobiose phosphorylase
LAGHSANDQVAESLMIAGLFCHASQLFADLYDHLGQTADAERIRAGYREMVAAVDEHGWDGEWFLRAYDAHGNPVGSSRNEEGKIYIESQGWCVLGGIGIEDGRARQALESVHEHLFFEHGCVLQQPPYTDYMSNSGKSPVIPRATRKMPASSATTTPGSISA